MLVIKRFTAAWCGPCRVLAPLFSQLEQEFPTVSFETIDVDQNKEEAAEYGIRSIPTVVYLKDGKVVNKLVGLSPLKTYTDSIKSFA